MFALKLIAWIIGVSSRTTAGTLAPLFFIGSSLGVMLCGMAVRYFPALHLDFKIAALVGFLLVVVFMTLSYGILGIFANITLVIDLFFILMIL
jgi:H+/Cl- antiporter ClcA